MRSRLQTTLTRAFTVDALPSRGSYAGGALLLALFLLVGLPSAYAQPNTNGLAFTGDAFGEATNPTSPQTELTVELWVKHTGDSDTDAVLVGNRIDPFNGDGYVMHLDGDGEDVHVAFRPSGDDDNHVVSETPLEKGRWYHVAGTYQETSDGVSTTLFINGTEDASITDNNFDSISNENDLVLGSTEDGSGNFFRGGLDDVRIWDRALSGIEISGNLNSELTGSEDGLAAYFKLNEASGSSFTNEVTGGQGSLLGEYTLSAPGSIPPVAPVDVHAEPGDGQVTVHFERPAYAETSVSEYTVYRTAQGGSRQQVGTVGASERTFTDTDVGDNTIYFYEVTATTDGGTESDYSERAHATVTDRSGLRFSGDTVSFNKTASQENLEAGTEIGLDFWVKYDEASDENAVLLGNKSNVEASGYLLQFIGGGQEVRIAFKPGNDNDDYMTSSTALEAGQWYHVAATYTSTSNGSSTKLFINGAQDASTTDFNFDSINNSNPLVFGASAGGGNVFQGALGNVRIWDTASISPSELINQSLVGNEEGLIGYWRFNEPQGSSIVRSSARPLSASLPSGVTLDTPGPRPAAPATVRTRPVDGNIELNFEQPDYTQASISEYAIYRTEQGGSRQQVATVDASQTTYTDANASSGTLFFYEVTANTSDGRESDFSVSEVAIAHPEPGGNALELSGTSSFLEFPQTPSLETLENGDAVGTDFWVKHSGESDSDAVLIGNKNNFNSSGFVVHFVGTGEAVNLAFKPGDDNDDYVTSNTALEAGQWYHVAATYTSTSNGSSTKLFIDGAQDASTTDFNFDSIGNSTPLVFGSTADKSSNFFQGTIDEVRLWKTAALTPGSLKDQILIGNEENLVGYWRLNEPQGSGVARSSARALTGTISNGSFVSSDVYSRFISVSPSALRFGEVDEGSTASQTFTITNEGDSTLTGDVSMETGSDGFAIQSGGGSFSLDSGNQKDVTVDFQPSSVGPFSGAVQVDYTADSLDNSLNVPLGGVGTSTEIAGSVWYPAEEDGNLVVESRALEGVSVRAASASDTSITTTASDGSFSFSGVSGGEYTLSVQVEGDSNHVETADALRTIRGFVGNAPFVGDFQAAVADIDGDGVDANDALQIQRFWLGDRTSFPAGSWRGARTTVSLNDAGAKDVTLWAAQTGDADLDGSAKSAKNAPLVLARSASASAKSTSAAGTKSIEAGETFEVPVRLDRAATLGAYGLAMNYPAQKVTFEGVSSAQGEVPFRDANGTVRLSWFDHSGGTSPIDAKAEHELVTLTFTAASDLDASGPLGLELVEGELSDAKGRSLANVGLIVPSLTFGTPAPDNFALKGNSPNPFRNRTRVHLDLPSDAQVRVTVYNVLGQRVKQVEKQMEAGPSRALELDASRLSSGTYFYRVKAEVDGETVEETGRMVQVQ